MACNFASNTNNRFILAGSICRLFLVRPHPPLSLFVSLQPASFSTCAGCMPRLQDKAPCVPGFGNLPLFSPPGSLPHHPGNLTTVCPSLSLPMRLDLFRPASSTPGPDRNTLKELDPHLKREKVMLVFFFIFFFYSLWDETKVSSHCIMRLAILQL